MSALPGFLAALALVLVAAPSVTAKPANKKLPASTLHGPISDLLQYPVLSAATAEQRAVARELLRQAEEAAKGWRTLAGAKAAGYDIRTATRRAGDKTVHYFHAEHGSFGPGHSYLDPWHPKALIYANLPPPWPIRLVGVMFAAPRGVQGKTPGGPITRWHSHTVCSLHGDRGLATLADGSCPPGTVMRQGSEMMHLWFTGDLRSAFSTHAPVKELGLSGLLPAIFCGVDH